MSETNPYAAPTSEIEDANAQQSGEIKVFSAKGRLARLQYLAYTFAFGLLAQLIITGVAVVIGVSPESHEPDMLYLIVSIAVTIPLVVISFMLTIQRLHDFNSSGWWSIGMLVPLANLILILVLMFVPGTKGSNRFGLKPPPNRWYHYLGGLALPVIAIVGILAAIAIPAYMTYVERAQQAQMEAQ